MTHQSMDRPLRLAGRLVALGLLGATMSPGLALAQPANGGGSTTPERPNIVLIMADDLGLGDIGTYGSTLIRTPHIDRLATEGLRLTDYYAPANVCTASRGGLLTGRYPIRLGLTADVARPTNTIGLAPAEVTLAELLGAAGYRTALVGKWHLGSQLDEHFPTKHGFDEFFGLLHSNDIDPLHLYDGELVVEESVDQSSLTERYTARALKFIEENRTRPFFLYLPHTFPHVPLHTRAPFAGASHAGLYGDVVETVDWSTGQILETLQRLDLDRRTLVIFTSDNGPWWEGSTGGQRDRKGSAWEGGMRVPFLARWPGRIPAGRVSRVPAMGIDILPTVAALAGVALPNDRKIDGENRWASWSGEGEVDASEERGPLFLFDASRIAAVRHGHYKLVVESKYIVALHRFDHEQAYYRPGLLFDLDKDATESYSFTRELPEIAERLYQWLVKARADLGAEIPPTMWSLPGRR